MYRNITVKGDAFECGRMYGKLTADLIHKNIKMYLLLFEFHSGLDKKRALYIAKSYEKIIQDHDENIYKEMVGIAEGANVSFDEILLLNTRTELLSNVTMGECTSFAIQPKATSDNSLWLCQNWDWFNLTNGLSVLLKICQSGKPEITMFVEAGHVGKMGFNNYGIGLCVNKLHHKTQGIGIPFIVLCRAILNCDQLSDAINEIYRYPIATSGNFLIVNKNGIVVDFEVTHDDVDFIEPQRGIIVHTNRFESLRLRQFDKGVRSNGGDSIVRKQFVFNVLDEKNGHIDLNLIKSIQRDRSNGFNSICMSSNESNPEQARWITQAGIIMNFTSKKLYITFGQPINNEYEVFDM